MLQVSITVIFSVRIRYQYQSKIHAFYPLSTTSLPFPPQQYIVNIKGIYTTLVNSEHGTIDDSGEHGYSRKVVLHMRPLHLITL